MDRMSLKILAGGLIALSFSAAQAMSPANAALLDQAQMEAQTELRELQGEFKKITRERQKSERADEDSAEFLTAAKDGPKTLNEE